MHEVEIAFLLDNIKEMREKLKTAGAKLIKAYNKATIYYNLNSAVDEAYRIKLYPHKLILDYKGGKMGDTSREEIEKVIENPEKEHEKLLKEHTVYSVHTIKWKNELYDLNGVKITLQPPCEGGFWDQPHVEVEKLVDSKEKENQALMEVKKAASELGLKNSVTRERVLKQEKLKSKIITKMPDFNELRKFVNEKYKFD